MGVSMFQCFNVVQDVFCCGTATLHGQECHGKIRKPLQCPICKSNHNPRPEPTRIVIKKRLPCLPYSAQGDLGNPVIDPKDPREEKVA